MLKRNYILLYKYVFYLYGINKNDNKNNLKFLQNIYLKFYLI